MEKYCAVQYKILINKKYITRKNVILNLCFPQWTMSHKDIYQISIPLFYNQFLTEIDHLIEIFGSHFFTMSENNLLSSFSSKLITTKLLYFFRNRIL